MRIQVTFTKKAPPEILWDASFGVSIESAKLFIRHMQRTIKAAEKLKQEQENDTTDNKKIPSQG